MPCAAGNRCACVPDHTPAPPDFTRHPCRVCAGYLHGMCGVVDPLGDSEMHRVCHNCANSGGRKTSREQPAEGQPEKRRCNGSTRAGSAQNGSGLILGQAVAKKPGGADKRTRVTLEAKMHALDLLETMSATAVAKKVGTGESTIYRWKKDEKRIRNEAASAKAGAKSTKTGDFPKVRVV